MMFRSRPEYKAAIARLNNAIEYWYTSVLEDDGSEELMLAAYNVAKIIRDYCPSAQAKFIPGQIFTAIQTALNAADMSDGIKPLQMEAQCMEALSRAVYRILKRDNKLISDENKVKTPSRSYLVAEF